MGEIRGGRARRWGVLAASPLLLGAVAAVSSAVPAGAAGGIATGCTPACSPGATVGLTKNGKPVPGAAGLYGWGAATMPDGSILIGDYWNYRIVHYNANGSEASPFVFAGKFGFGAGRNQAPFGICVDTSPATADYGDVFMTEGSLYDVNMYNASGGFVTSWGTTDAANPVNLAYPSQCAVDPLNGLLYVSNQWGQSLVILDPTHPSTAAQFVSPPSPDTFIQPRGLAFDPTGRLFLADEGHKRIDIYNNPTASVLSTSKPDRTILPPTSAGSTTFDMRGLALDTATKLLFVTNGQNCVVQEFNADPSSSNYGGYVLTFNHVASGASNCGTPGKMAPLGEFEDGARGLAVDGTGHVWAGDLADFRAQVFDESGTVLFAVPNPAAPPPDGGFNGPRGLAFDPAGDMYVTDMFNERIEEFSLSSGSYVFQQAWGMRGDSPGTMDYPRLLCWDPLSNGGSGALIVADTDAYDVVAWNPNASKGPRVVWSASGFADPYGVACDAASGTVYVADSNAKDVVALDRDGNTLGTIGTGTISGFTRGIAVDTDGSVWTSVGATGRVYHFASWQNGGGALSGAFTTPSGSNPFGIAADANYLYVAFSSSDLVGQYTKSGTLVGTFGGLGSAVGQMHTPQGLGFAGPGSQLFVVEENNNRVAAWTVP